MGETEYSEALKLGKKEYRARIAKGQFPYLPVLDEILSEADICLLYTSPSPRDA